LGEAFDRVILYEDHYPRGRADGEIMGLFRKGLASAPRAREVQEFHGNLKAIESALRTARPGELLVVQADVIDETLDYIRRYLACNDASREINLRQAIEASSNAAVVYASQITD